MEGSSPIEPDPDSLYRDDDTFPQHLRRIWTTLLLRYDKSQDLAILSVVISMIKCAIEGTQLILKDRSHVPEWFLTLARAQHSCYLHTKDAIHISDAISSLRKGIDLHPEEVIKNKLLTNLSLYLFLRFLEKHDLDDISEAILLMERLITLEESSVSHNLECLSYFYGSRFELLQDFKDLSNAISIWEKRMQITQENDQDFPKLLERMSFLLRERFKLTNNLEDLSLAIAMKRERNNMKLPVNEESLTSLAILQYEDFVHTQELADLDEAILSPRNATEVENIHGSRSHERSGTAGALLAFALYSRSKRTEDSGADLEMVEALAFNAMNEPNIRPTIRQDLVLLLLLLNHLSGDNSEKLETIGHLNIQLLSEIAPLSQPIQTRHSALSLKSEDLRKFPHPFLLFGGKDPRSPEISRLIRDLDVGVLDLTSPQSLCVWQALESNRLNQALGWLEQGRCHVWNQLNQLRTPVEDLRAHDPALAERFLKLSEALEAAGSGTEESVPSTSFMSPRLPREDVTKGLDRDWTQLLEDIRVTPKFQNFLQPRRASDILENLSTHGPVIIVHVEHLGCTALALLPGNDEPIPIRLNDFSYSMAERLRTYLTAYLVSSGRMRSESEDRGIRKVYDHPLHRNPMHTILEALWVRVVKPVLDVLGYSVSCVSVQYSLAN